MDKNSIDYKAAEAFVKENKQEYDALVRRFVAADASLTTEELAKAYYASPFAGHKPLSDLLDTANRLYRIRDYRVAYYMYRDALECDPLSLLVLKKAANCCYFAVIDRDATAALRSRVKMLQDVILATGDGATAQSPIRVVKTSDAYQVLWEAVGVKDVLSCKVVAEENGESVDELLVQVRDEKEPRKVYVACLGESEDDRADFFIRKKGF